MQLLPKLALPKPSITRFTCMALIGLLAGCAALSTRTVSISEADIQSKIAKNLSAPITLLKIFNVSLSNPIVKLDEKTGRLNTIIDANIVTPLNKTPMKGKFSISGTPRFDSNSNTLMLSQTKIESLAVDGASPQLSALINAFNENFSADFLNEIPLYAVKPNDLKVGNTLYTPTEFKVIGNHLEVTLKAN